MRNLIFSKHIGIRVVCYFRILTETFKFFVNLHSVPVLVFFRSYLRICKELVHLLYLYVLFQLRLFGVRAE